MVNLSQLLRYFLIFTIAFVALIRGLVVSWETSAMLASRKLISLKSGSSNYQSWPGLLGASIVWLLLSFSFYSLMCVIRETFRVLTFAATREYLLLSDKEFYFYNFFFASIACITTSGFIANLFLSSPLLRSRHLGYHKPKLINTLTGLNWYFLLWFGRLGILFGLFCTIGPIFYYIDLYRDYKFIFMASPVLLFVYQWSWLHRVLKGGMRWMFISGGIVLTISFLFSRIDIIGVQGLDAVIQKYIVSYNYHLQLPQASEATDISRWEGKHRLYLVRSKDSVAGDTPVIVVDGGDGLFKLTLSDIGSYVNSIRATFSYSEPTKLLVGVDASVKMRHVKALRKVISQDHGHEVYWLTATNKPGTQQGLYQYLSSSCRWLISLHIEELIRQGKLPEQRECPGITIEINLDNLLAKSLPVRLLNNEMYIGDSLTAHEELFRKVSSFINKYGGSGVVTMEVDDDSDYGHYLQLQNAIRGAYNLKRDELSYAQTGKPFPRYTYEHRTPEDAKIFLSIREKYPISILEWTTEELHALELLQTAKQSAH